MEQRDSGLVKKVIERDRKCMLCGTSNELVVHHIIPLTDGGTDNLDNMITLCDRHHYLYHHWPPEDEVSGTRALVIRGMDTRAKAGHVQYKAPLGYKYVDGKIIVDEEEAAKVRGIFTDYIKHRSMAKVAQIHGIPNAKTVQRILSNETYLGYVKWRGISTKGVHAAVVDEGIFNKVKKIRAEMRKRNQGK